MGMFLVTCFMLGLAVALYVIRLEAEQRRIRREFGAVRRLLDTARNQ